MASRRKNKSGFTLIEILIVVIILGILAAIVIPQFASASTQAKQSTVQSVAQTLRTQIALYRLQHNDRLPGLSGSAFSSETFWAQMTAKTDGAGFVWLSTTTAGGPFGPYLQAIPTNALNGSSLVLDGNVPIGGWATSACGYQYDFTGGSGNIWGTDATGKVVLP